VFSKNNGATTDIDSATHTIKGNSIERVGISRYGEFVILKFSCHDANGNCKFHGYVGGKDFWELEEPQRQALIRNGMTTRRGRILRYGR